MLERTSMTAEALKAGGRQPHAPVSNCTPPRDYSECRRNVQLRQPTCLPTRMSVGVVAIKNDEMCQNKTRLDTCLQELPQLESPGIPSDKEAVDTACRAFKKGMLCFDQYVNTCIEGEDRIVINSNVAGARKAFISLCDDPHFQSEYLQHASCYRNVSKDWEKCSRRFMLQIRSGQSAKLCCARSAFLECAYDAGTRHCRPDSAKFLRQIAEMLSNAHFYRTSCHPSTTSASLCSFGNYLRPQLKYLVPTSAIVIAMILRVNV